MRSCLAMARSTRPIVNAMLLEVILYPSVMLLPLLMPDFKKIIRRGVNYARDCFAKSVFNCNNWGLVVIHTHSVGHCEVFIR